MNRKPLRRTINTLCSILALVAFASEGIGQAQQSLLQNAVEIKAAPQFGTFYSLQFLQPPLPINLFPDLPLYQIGVDAYVYDDRSVDYLNLWAISEVEDALLSAMSAPPVPGGGGGGGSGTGITNTPPYGTPGLKLTIPTISNGALYTTVFEADTNSAYDLFEKFVLQNSLPWSRVAFTEIGGTNFAVTVASPTTAFYAAADTTDSDFDGISDAFEQLITHTNPLLADSNGNGVPDGMEDFNGNLIPDGLEYRGISRAITYASRTNAYEGGQPGEITLQLPAPAPAGGVLALIHLTGTAEYDSDYRLATLAGASVTNEVAFSAGAQVVKLQVTAVDDVGQVTRSRTASISLMSAGSFLVDSKPAVVTIIDNDLPSVSIVAADAVAAEASGTATNTGRIVLLRDGSLAAPLTVRFSVGGTATGGSDYTVITSPVTIPAGSNRVSLIVQPLPDSIYEDDEIVTLTLTADAAYSINASAASASVTIKDDDLPVVTIAVTDALAAEYNGPDQGAFSLRRTGKLSKPLTVPIAISGTATNGVDYQTLTNIWVIPANSSNVTLQLIPINNPYEEQAESVIVTVKASTAYAIGASNTATILIDDNSPTRYQVFEIKHTSVYATGIDSPAVYEIQRFGRSSQAATLPFQIRTNVSGGTANTSFYRVYGDVQGSTTASFTSFATKARLNFTAPSTGIISGSGGVSLYIPSSTRVSGPLFISRAGNSFMLMSSIRTPSKAALPSGPGSGFPAPLPGLW